MSQQTVPFGTHVFTTGQAAAVLLCAPKTVMKAIDRGTLKGFRVPGSLFRRILRADLVAYCRANGLAHALEALGEPE